MKCPKCGKAGTAPKAACLWCWVLVSNSDAGVATTPGSRLAAYMLEVVIGAVLAGIILSTVANKREEAVRFWRGHRG